jgi:hypothetical protein
MIPIGGSSPGEIDANARPRSPDESEIQRDEPHGIRARDPTSPALLARLSHALRAVNVLFDDPNLVSCAGSSRS